MTVSDQKSPKALIVKFNRSFTTVCIPMIEKKKSVYLAI